MCRPTGKHPTRVFSGSVRVVWPRSAAPLSRLVITNPSTRISFRRNSSLILYTLFGFPSLRSSLVGVPSGQPPSVVPSRVRASSTLTEPKYPRYISELATYIKQPLLKTLTQQFLSEQLDRSDNSSISSHTSDIHLPEIISKINVYHSATAVFFAPSDHSGMQGMKRERIRSTPSWRGHERRDCVLVTIDEDKPGFKGLSTARVLLFFSFKYEDTTYSCALIHWFNTYGQRPDPKTGLWMVRPAFWDQAQRKPCLAVVHLDALVRAVHLIPVFGSQALPIELEHHQSLDVFKTFYVNKYADHHANEILF
ncbi:hypothetical protein C8R42DRAFT_728400 [Lentinula raphanica]|nr:hypothetical protein C8R42DRAFT_728400 [Lentinula raphanica]